MTTSIEQAPADWLSASQAADLLGGVSTRTLANWADQGLLHPVRGPSGRGHRRYRGHEVRELAAQLAIGDHSPDIARPIPRAGAA